MKKKTIQTLGLIIGLGLLLFGVNASAATVPSSVCASNPSASICASDDLNSSTKFTNSVSNLAGAALFIVGIAAVIAIIVSAINYLTANGESKKMEKAKKSLIYSIAGLVVALLSYAIVSFVVSRI